MSRKLHYLLLIVLIGASGSALAQEILGDITDPKKKEPIINAKVVALQGGIQKGITITDIDGHYSIKPLEPGTYDIIVTHPEYKQKTLTGIAVSPSGKAECDVKMSTGELETVVVSSKKLISKYETAKTMSSKDIKNAPVIQTADLVATAAGVRQATRGGQLNSDGGRGTGNVFIIDGVQVQGSTGIDMAQNSVDQIEVISSGIPAKYGDVSGAVVNITSRGVAPKFSGSVKAQHSLDGYNNNMVAFSIAGPLLKKKYIDSNTHKREPYLGFALSGDYSYDQNRYPSYFKTFQAKGDVLERLHNSPLKVSSDNNGLAVYNPSSLYVTQADLEQVKKPSHNTLQEVKLVGKLDLKINNEMKLIAGGNMDYTSQDQYAFSRNLFAPEATPTSNTLTGRGFLRFTQRLGKQNFSLNDTGKKAMIANASYILQVDYQKLYQTSFDPNFKYDIFKYGYIGKFQTQYQDIYIPNFADSTSGRNGTTLLFKAPVGIDYTQSTLNPVLSQYTTQYYSLLSEGGFKPSSLQSIQAHNALVNGDEPTFTYGMFYSPGSTQTGYSLYNSNQYGLTIDASFDLKLGKVTHEFEFGMYYNQRVISSYSISGAAYGGNSLWQAMRQLVSSYNNGNLKLDKTNPIFIVNGNRYTLADVNAGKVRPAPTDTITYNYINPVQTNFDKQLRKKLGLGKTDNIDIDALDPSTFNLNMFSADEMLNSGNPYASYYGYNYDGTNQSGTVNFNDFWTKKDADGNYTRPLAPFRPNMIAGYLLDRFEFKNINFNIGVRVERYSANTKVLKDPFSLYETKDVAQSGLTNTLNGGVTPSNIARTAVVYVDDNSSTNPTVIGYRDGSRWYDYTGKEISDPGLLKNYSGGRDPQPLLVSPKVKINDTAFNPNGSFTDYNPAVTVMPRITISFPISDVSKFVAHYDIYSQRPYPTALGYATAYDYYFLNQNSNQIISNANLRPEKTFDYELGFNQVIGSNAVLSIFGFYKERKDMITVVPYLYAWPTTYYTYGNRDFSSTKGVKLSYEMRATNHLQLSMNYTLQFAEGTGSSPFSTNSGGGGSVSPNGLLQSFISAGLPNLRYISALDYDSRHAITISADYRFNEGEGPVLFDKHILQNAGVNLILKGRSGEPYTRMKDVIGNTIVGGINGSRLPWHFGADMKINKDFELAFGKAKANAKADDKSGMMRKVHKVGAYIYIQNLFNTRDILGVYGYTGRPDDDGYLASPNGKVQISNQVSPQSYQDLYNISHNYGNVNYARTINFGLEYNF